LRRRFLLAALAMLAASSGRAASCPPGLFLEASSFPAGPTPGAIVVGNFNADTIPDLAVANRNGSTVSVLLGNGDGTFGPPIESDSDYNQWTLAVGDFNGDGKADLAAGTYARITILLGNGDGTFQAPVQYDVGNGTTRSIQVGKLDAGDTLDLVATTDYGDEVYVLLGNGNGTFGPASGYGAGGQVRNLALGDFDGDGNLDVVATHPNGNTISLLPGTGNGALGPASPFVVGTSPGDIVSADFNGDGHPDLAVQTGSYVSILIGDGAGAFGAALQYPSGANSLGLLAGDFDGDTRIDLAVQSGDVVSILRGDGQGAFTPGAAYLTGEYGDALAGGDFNGDGALDIANSNPNDASVTILLASGSGSFEASRSVAVPGGASVLATGFFNGDSILDIAAVNGGAVQILLGDPLGGYVLAGSYDAGMPATFVIAADFTNDSITDLVVSGYLGVWLLRGVGDGSFVPEPNSISTASYAGSMVAGFFHGNGPLDLAIATGCCGFGGIQVLPGHGDGTFGDPIFTDLSSTPGALSASDLNWDGATDLATTDSGHNRVLVLLGKGDGTFETPVAYPVQQGPAWLVAGWDVDEDGNTDMVVANTISQNLSILRGVGDGTFTTGPILAVGQPAVFVAAADFDGDDHFDIYTANGSGNSVSVFRGLGAGAFASPQTYATGANATYGVLVDADDNSRIDLAVATPGDNAITLLLSAQLGIGTVAGSLDACVGSTVTLSVEASGFGPVSYQWRKDDVPLSDGGNVSGAQTAHLTLSPVGGLDTATYSVQVSDLCTTLVGSIDYLWAHDPPAAPVIALESLPAPGLEGSASATPGAFDYVWTATGGVITGGQHTSTATFLSDVPGTVTLKVTEYSAPACATESAPTDVLVDYLDVPPSNIFHDDVVTIAQAHITAGCGNGDYCPASVVTRAQMAVLLLKSLYGSGYVPPASVQVFPDVPPGSFAYDWINALAAIGVTSGCGGGNYCPSSSVTRAQMAVFLLKTLYGSAYAPPPATAIFDDVPVDAFAADFIDDLYTRGFAGGCNASPLLYCPNSPVKRGQMAAFLVNAFF